MIKKDLLKHLINECISEVLSEVDNTTPGITYINNTDPQKDNKITAAQQQKQSYKIITEMSGLIKYTITDPSKFNPEDFGKDAHKAESIYNFLSDLAKENKAGDQMDYGRSLASKKISPEDDEEGFKKLAYNINHPAGHIFRKMADMGLIDKVSVAPIPSKEKYTTFGSEIIGEKPKHKSTKSNTNSISPETDDEDDNTPKMKKSLSSYFNDEHPDLYDMFVGDPFEDDFESGVLHIDDVPNKEKNNNSQPNAQSTNPTSKAADFVLDNDRELQKLINTYGLSRNRGKNLREDAENDKTISSKRDFVVPEKKRMDKSKEDIGILVKQFADKINSESDFEVKKAILDILSRKLSLSNNSYLFKLIAKEVNMDEPINIPKDIDQESADDLDDNEEIDSDEEDHLNESFERMQRLAGLLED